jgi:ATP-dependent helicase/DNAse subunit B
LVVCFDSGEISESVSTSKPTRSRKKKLKTDEAQNKSFESPSQSSISSTSTSISESSSTSTESSPSTDSSSDVDNSPSSSATGTSSISSGKLTHLASIAKLPTFRSISNVIHSALKGRFSQIEVVSPDANQIIQRLASPTLSSNASSSSSSSAKQPRSSSPVIDSAGMVSLSYSSLSDYMACPLRYYFGYVKRIPRPQNIHLIYGRAMHDAVEEYSKHRMRGRIFLRFNSILVSISILDAVLSF